MGATQIILIAVIVILVILYPILTRIRNQKDIEKLQQQTNSLKKGTKVLTTSGIYGTVVEIREEEERTFVVIETGSKDKKGYLAIEAFAIYTVFEDENKTEKLPAEVKPADIEVEAKQLNKTLEKTETKIAKKQKQEKSN